MFFIPTRLKNSFVHLVLTSVRVSGYLCPLETPPKIADSFECLSTAVYLFTSQAISKQSASSEGCGIQMLLAEVLVRWPLSPGRGL